MYYYTKNAIKILLPNLSCVFIVLCPNVPDLRRGRPANTSGPGGNESIAPSLP